MSFTDDKAVMRGPKVLPGSNYQSRNNQASNHVRFANSGPDSNVSTPSVGEAEVGANTEGTGTEGVPTGVALLKKQKLGVPMPANF